MLTHLKIENIAVIESADIDFAENLNILTGETGAGKSIVIDSINAILGERTSKELIRTGSEKAKVIAEFDDISESIISKLNYYDIDYEDGDCLIISRTITHDGRSNCRINGQPVNVSTLKDIGSELITICGQHDSQKLLQKNSHLQYIDSLAEDAKLLSSYRDVYRQLKSAEKKLSELSCDENEKQQRLEFLEYQINELENADIKIGEKEDLQTKKKRILNREKIIQSLHSVIDIINGNDSFSGLTELIYQLSNQLSLLEDVNDSFKEFNDSVENFKYEVEECASSASGELTSFDYEEDSLDEIESRLDLIYRLSKKYGYTEEEMLQKLDSLKKEYDDIQCSDEQIIKLQKEIELLNEDVFEKAIELSRKRKSTAELFSESVKSELKYLDMEGADFQVKFEEVKPTENGIDSIEFIISPNPGQELKPLSKIASGGELSRVMLAIRCVLSKAETIDSMIFDEIDTGVSGKASGKIAIKLKQLSKNKQVICVTHLPQIASGADSHLFIEKEVTENNTLTHISTLSYEERINEIARIISGDTITKSTLESAREMIEIFNN